MDHKVDKTRARCNAFALDPFQPRVIQDQPAAFGTIQLPAADKRHQPCLAVIPHDSKLGDKENGQVDENDSKGQQQLKEKIPAIHPKGALEAARHHAVERNVSDIEVHDCEHPEWDFLEGLAPSQRKRGYGGHVLKIYKQEVDGIVLAGHHAAKAFAASESEEII